ncbi:MAG: LamG domain-containing protein [Anaerolineae bacterium]|nr:LamG domain-containing protein [Anaerolineae bacterium]
MRAYKNGVEVGNIVSAPTAQPPGLPILYIGGLVESSQNHMFSGQIDEVQIWNVVRSAAQIRRDMYRDLTGSESGLAAYYSMSNGTGTILNDDSVNNWNGTILDGFIPYPGNGIYARWSSSGAFVGPRNTLDFDGVDDYVDIVNNAATVIGAGWATDKSGDVWVKPTSAGLAAANASQGEWIFGGPNWGVSQATIGGEDRLWVWNNDGNEDRIGLDYTPGEWVHITLVHSGGRLTAYRDTILAGSSTSGSTVADGNLTIGGLATGQAFAGQIDELRLWDDARSLLEVQSYVYQTVAFDEGGLRAYYRFDQQNQAGQTEVVDSSNYGHQATMINMTPTTDWLPSTAFNTWVGSDSQAWNGGGNWSRNTTTNRNLGITRYSGSYGATITTSTAVTNAVVVSGANLVVSDSLTINGNVVNLGIMDAANISVTAGASLEMHSGGAMTVTGLLQNSGTLKQTQAVDGSGVVGFFDTGGYGGLTIDSGGQNLGDTAVIIRGNQQCTTVVNETALRCFNITPQIAPAVGISITFAFADSELPITMDCSLVSIFHWNGGVWTEITPTVRNCSQPVNYITVENVVTFSPLSSGKYRIRQRP